MSVIFDDTSDCTNLPASKCPHACQNPALALPSKKEQSVSFVEAFLRSALLWHLALSPH